MSVPARLRSLVRNLFSRDRVDRQLDEEIRHALDVLTEEKLASGLAPAEARRAAMMELGGPDLLKEQVRDARTGGRIAETMRDVRFGLRLLRRDVSFSAAALFTLALGIGATTAIFSVVSGLVLRPLPFADPARLVQVFGTSNFTRSDGVANLPRYREATTSFEQFAAVEVSASYLNGAEGAERVLTVRTDGDLFGLLGVPPLEGRTYHPSDGRNVAVISETFWRRQFQADPGAIGRTLLLDDRPLVIVGVMPARFQFPYGAASLLSGGGSQGRTDVWMPLAQSLGLRSRIGNVIGRLKPGVSRTAAEAEMVAIAKRLEADYPDTNIGRSITLAPLSEVVVAPAVRRVLFMLFGAVGLLLLLACANVANLSLVRTALRSREVAIRTALGASRRRLVRQFLTESLCLSLAGGALGLGLAWWGSRELLRAAAAEIPRAHEVGLDWRVFLFLFAVCAMTGALIGVAPAYFAGRRDVQPALQAATGRTTMSSGQRRLRNALVVAEVALAFVLAIGATLLVRELMRLRNTDLGMTTSNVITLHVGQRFVETKPEQLAAIEQRVSELSGVRAAGFSQLLPLQNWGWTGNSSTFFVKGSQPPTPFFPIHLRFVTPGYFQALQIGVERGRAFTADDTPDKPGVIMINGTLARRYFGDSDPVGLATNRGLIVGVVRDFRQINADQPSFPELYTPIAQNWSQVNELGMTLIVRTQGNPELAMGPIRAAVREVSPRHAIFSVKTMDQVVTDSLSTFTLFLTLIAAFAGLALVLALSGTYGVIAYVANSRLKEFAIRMTLGADRAQVTRLVVRQGVVLTGLGLAFGLVATFLAAPLLRGLPITVRPPDVMTAVPVALGIAIVATLACLIPALRASGVNPMRALRNE